MLSLRDKIKNFFVKFYNSSEINILILSPFNINENPQSLPIDQSHQG
jgi:hypothetical protein